MTRKRTLAYLAILTNVIIWGAAIPIVKPSLTFVSPFYFLFLRYLIASLILLPFLFLKKPKSLTLKQLLTIVVLEFFVIVIGHSLLYLGLSSSTALESSLIASTSPVLIILGGILFLREKEERNEWIGLTLSIIGTTVIILSPFLASKINTPSSIFGNLLVFAYTLIWAIYILSAKKLYKNINKIFITSVSCVVGALSFILIINIMGPKPAFFEAIKIIPVTRAALYMGILGSPVAVSLYLYGQNKIEASEATLFTYLQPLIYIPLSIIWLQEKIIFEQIIGLLIVILGVFIAEKRSSRSISPTT